jgi:hypothetical protein
MSELRGPAMTSGYCDLRRLCAHAHVEAEALRLALTGHCGRDWL